MTDKSTIFRRIGFAPIFAEVMKSLGEYLKEIWSTNPIVHAD